MLLTLTHESRARPPEPPQPGPLLLECHGRIRAFCETAIRLAEATPGDDDVGLADAAGALHRYFSIALPLHERDEEESLLPLLLPHASGSPELAEALARIAPEHAAIDALLQDLLPAWARIAERPERLASAATTLVVTSHALVERMAAHLALEERLLFPALRELVPAAQKAELLAELRARRA